MAPRTASACANTDSTELVMTDLAFDRQKESPNPYLEQSFSPTKHDRKLRHRHTPKDKSNLH